MGIRTSEQRGGVTASAGSRAITCSDIGASNVGAVSGVLYGMALLAGAHLAQCLLARPPALDELSISSCVVCVLSAVAARSLIAGHRGCVRLVRIASASGVIFSNLLLCISGTVVGALPGMVCLATYALASLVTADRGR